ncbi:hypothetical protein EQ500_09085, partial [Lactobacillus sp. XV13L]|nr:hypothetical protein [Lactobacillus sp. XV13L]
MKKSSLMGASVVAAALLAAAPIAAPVANIASGTQVVKADDATPAQLNEAVSKIKQQSTGTTLTTSDLPSFFEGMTTQLPALAGQYTALTTFGTDLTTSALYVHDTNLVVSPVGANFLPYFFSGNKQVALITDANAQVTKGMKYSLKFEYSDAVGKVSYQIRNDGDVERAMNDLRTNGGNVTMTMQLYTAYNQPISNGVVKSTVSYNVANNRAAFVRYNDTLN